MEFSDFFQVLQGLGILSKGDTFLRPVQCLQHRCCCDEDLPSSTAYCPRRTAAWHSRCRPLCSWLQASHPLHALLPQLPSTEKVFCRLKMVEQMVGLGKGLPWVLSQTPGANLNSQAQGSSQKKQKNFTDFLCGLWVE